MRRKEEGSRSGPAHEVMTARTRGGSAMRGTAGDARVTGGHGVGPDRTSQGRADNQFLLVRSRGVAMT